MTEHGLYRLVGLFCLTLSGACLLLVLANWEARLNGGRDITALAYAGGTLLTISVLAIVGVRMAGFLLTLACCLIGAGLVVGSLWSVPFPWVLINVMYGSLGALPLALLVLVRRRSRRRSGVQPTSAHPME